MPEVVITGIDVQKVQGRVEVAGRGAHDVTVFFDRSARAAYAEVSTPEGQELETGINGPIDALGPGALLEAAVRGALIDEA